MDDRIEFIRKWINDDDAMNILVSKNHPIIRTLIVQAKLSLSKKKEFLLEQKTEFNQKISNYQEEIAKIDAELVKTDDVKLSEEIK